MTQHQADRSPAIVGEAPSRASGAPLSGRSGAVLSAAFGADVGGHFELINLLYEWPGSAGKGSAFPVGDAARRAAELDAALGDRPRVLLGKRVAEAFGLSARAREYHAWSESFRAGAPQVVVPHPSGVNRTLNDPRERAKLGASLRLALLSERLRGRVGAFYADPPWGSKDQDPRVGASHRYPVMTTEAICSLGIPIRRMAAKGSALFLWAMTSMKYDALAVMESWGWRYRTTAYWVKNQIGCGSWFRNKVEEILVGSRGPIRAFHCQKSNAIHAKRGEHSAKPKEAYELIEDAIRGVSGIKLEMFARHDRAGWASWGTNVSSCNVLL